jgi:hypothetical protein
VLGFRGLTAIGEQACDGRNLRGIRGDLGTCAQSSPAVQCAAE